MKIRILCVSVWASFLIGYLNPAWAAEVPYNFQTVDISIPGRPDAVVWLKDINSKGQILASTFWMQNGQPLWGSLISKLNPRLNKLTGIEIFFTCTGVRINDRGTIIGSSADGACMRQPNGQVTTLTALPQTVGFGISTDRVSGSYCVPNGPPNFGCTEHGFTWSPVEDYRTIDLPAAPGTEVRTVPLAPNNHGQLLIEYYVELPTNETLEHGFCIYANGTCGAPFALSFEWRGGPGRFIPDFNEDGQAIVQCWNGDASCFLQLYDEGFFAITGWPASWLLSSLEGMSNEAAFVGAYLIQTGFDPYYQRPVLKRHNFVAAPAPVRAASR